MNLTKLIAPSLACAVFGSPVAAQALAQIKFAAPKRVHAGDKLLGAGRYYPSPVFHDVNGDGTLDIVVGDLLGKVTFAPGVAGKPGVFGKEEPLLDRDGKQLKFHNW